jgi:hypothetical protein
MPVSFSDVQLAFEFVSSGGMGENEAYPRFLGAGLHLSQPSHTQGARMGTAEDVERHSPGSAIFGSCHGLMIMRTFPGLLTVAFTLSACATGGYDPQTVTDNARGGALAQIMAEWQEQTVAP